MNRIGILMVALALGGCASAGTSFEWSNAKQVTLGMTEAEVVSLLGKPNSVVSQGDVQVWRWVHSSASVFTGAAVRHVSFPMRGGRVIEVPNLTQF